MYLLENFDHISIVIYELRNINRNDKWVFRFKPIIINEQLLKITRVLAIMFDIFYTIMYDVIEKSASK